MTDVVVVRLFANGDKAMYPVSESNGKTYFTLVKIVSAKEYELQSDASYKVSYNVRVYSQLAPTTPSVIIAEESKLITLSDFNTLSANY
jgi:hypothetical protein